MLEFIFLSDILFEGYLGSLFIYVYKGVLVDMQGCTIAYEWSFWIGLIN